MAQDLVTVTRDQAGQIYDWPQMLSGLFRVHSVKAQERPPGAHVATQYHGYWFYIDETDQDTKSTFSLLMELGRALESRHSRGLRTVLIIALRGR